MFFKKGVLRNVTKLTEKYLCQSLLEHLFFKEHLRLLLLWFILVVLMVVTWVNWFSRHRFKLEAKDFMFQIPNSPEKFCKFQRANTCFVFNKKSSGFYFSLFHSQLVYTCSKHGLVQSLVKTFPKWIYFFFSQVAHNCSN